MTAVQQLQTTRGNFQSSMGMFLIQSFSSEAPVTNMKISRTINATVQHHNAAAVTIVTCSSINESKLLFFPRLSINQGTGFYLHFIL
jgi:hypothetical protein